MVQRLAFEYGQKRVALGTISVTVLVVALIALSEIVLGKQLFEEKVAVAAASP